MPRRRRRSEPAWPVALVAGIVVGGLAVGALLTSDAFPEGEAARALEAEEAAGGGEPPIPAAWDRIRVEVLNAGGIRGAAAEAKDRLRGMGFDVVYFGNAPTFGRDTSVVLDRTGAPGAAPAVGRALDIGRVAPDPDTTLLVDVTVLLGTDWSGEAAAGGDGSGREEADREDGGARPWWDLRRFFEVGR